jgi:uncharacterized membrane protein
MMDQEPTQFIIALFQDEEAARTAYLGLQDAQAEKELAGMREAAVIRKDIEDKVHIWEDQDLSGSEGAMFGGVVGALAGLILGPGAIITGVAGAVIGGLIGKLEDTGFDNKSLKALARSLKAGSSALLVVVDDVSMPIFSERLALFGAQVITDYMDPEVAQKLQEEYATFMTRLKEIGPDELLAKNPDEIAKKVEAIEDQTLDDYHLDPSRGPLL